MTSGTTTPTESVVIANIMNIMYVKTRMTIPRRGASNQPYAVCTHSSGLCGRIHSDQDRVGAACSCEEYSMRASGAPKSTTSTAQSPWRLQAIESVRFAGLCIVWFAGEGRMRVAEADQFD